MTDSSPDPPTVVVGGGWLGQALGAHLRVLPVPRRRPTDLSIPPGGRVVVASGRSSVDRADEAAAMAEELAHVRRVLDVCAAAGASRVVLVNSADVAGSAATIRGSTPLAPTTSYGRVKAAVEQECVMRRAAGMPLTSVRLAPTHGAGKARTRQLARLATRRVVVLPNGGRASTGFVLLDDALAALEWLLQNDAPAVVSVGAGPTPMRDLIGAIAAAKQRTVRFLGVPVPVELARRIDSHDVPDAVHWALRLSSPRAVFMETPTAVSPLPDVGRALAAC